MALPPIRTTLRCSPAFAFTVRVATGAGLLAGFLVLVFVAGRSVRQPSPPPFPAPVGAPETDRAEGLPVRVPASASPVTAARDFYRREQIRLELELEQRRYGSNYWDPEAGGRLLRELHEERLARLAELEAERTAVLNELGADPADAAAGLTPLFDPEHPGPFVGCLSPASREQVEDLMAALGAEEDLTRAALLEQVRDVLSGPEATLFEQWNSPASARLRQQLIGFGATAEEFDFLAQWPGAVNPPVDDEPEAAIAEEELRRRLGAERHAELRRLHTPEMQTALHDLHRLGLPLRHAGWLAEFRARSIETIQDAWQDPAATSAEKAVRVARLQQAYRTGLQAMLAPAVAGFDGGEFLP